MELSIKCNGVRKGFVLSICVAFAIISLDNRDQSGSSHRIYKTPWEGDPRVNIQNAKGMAKAYQVRQVLKAIERLKRENEKK